MLAFLFFSCLLGGVLWWVATSTKEGGDDPVGQLLCSVPRVFTQPHLLATPPDVSSSSERSSDDDTPSDAAPPSRSGARGPGPDDVPGPAADETIDAPSSDGKRRPLFDAPAERDDLKRISGIGPVMERHLNELGVVSFAQLASFDDDDIARVDAALTDFRGRIVRDDWVGQARAFTTGERR